MPMAVVYDTVKRQEPVLLSGEVGLNASRHV
jgi:hypothetical protein